jgi:signal transduction histidine kinase
LGADQPTPEQEMARDPDEVTVQNSLFLEAGRLGVEVVFEASCVNASEVLAPKVRSVRLGAIVLAALLALSLGVTLRAVVYSRSVGAYQRELIDALAHELHTPLTTLHVGLRTLEDHVGEDNSQTVQRLLRQVRRLQRLAQRVTAGSRALLHDAAPDLAVRRPDEEIERQLEERFPEALQSGSLVPLLNAPDATVLAASADLEILVCNLVENAIKHGGREGTQRRSSLRVMVATRLEGQKFVLRVEDDGPGQHPKLNRHLIRPFVRGDETTGGLGLGLYLCRRIARRLGGRLSLGPSELGGMRARVTLPLFRERAR